MTVLARLKSMLFCGGILGRHLDGRRPGVRSKAGQHVIDNDPLAPDVAVSIQGNPAVHRGFSARRLR